MIISLLIRFFIFSLPILIFYGAYDIFLFRSGELNSVKASYENQQQYDECIYQRASLSQQINIYKLEAVKKKKPKILVLGNSEVMQIRDFMFHPFETDFYNGGGLARNVQDFREFASMMERNEISKPEVMIIGVDDGWFTTKHPNKESWLLPKNLKDNAFNLIARLNSIHFLISNVSFLPRFRKNKDGYLCSNYNYQAIGLLPILKNTGFRKDGSSFDGNHIRRALANPEKYLGTFPNFLFTKYAQWDADRVKMFISALKRFREMNIEIILFQPPVANMVEKEFEDKNIRDLWSKYKNELVNMLNDEGFDCYRVTQPKDFGLTDLYMLDRRHPGEVLISIILGKMLKNIQKSSFLDGLDLKKLRMIRTQAYSSLSIHDVPID